MAKKCVRFVERTSQPYRTGSEWRGSLTGCASRAMRCGWPETSNASWNYTRSAERRTMVHNVQGNRPPRDAA